MPRYDVMSCLKEVTGLQQCECRPAGVWGGGTFLFRHATEQLAPKVSVGQLCCLPVCCLIPQCHGFITGQLNQSKAKYQFEATP